MVKRKAFLIGLIILILTIIFGFILKTQQYEVKDPEPLYNYWTIIHFSGGTGLFLIIASYIENRIISIIISFIILILIEIYEIIDTPAFWIRSWGNNIVDILVGAFGIIIGIKILKWARAQN